MKAVRQQKRVLCVGGELCSDVRTFVLDIGISEYFSKEVAVTGLLVIVIDRVSSWMVGEDICFGLC